MQQAPLAISWLAAVGGVLSSFILGGICLPLYWNEGRHLVLPQCALAVSATSIATLFAVAQVNITMALWWSVLVLMGAYVISTVWLGFALFGGYSKGHHGDRLPSLLQMIAVFCMIVSASAYIMPGF